MAGAPDWFTTQEAVPAIPFTVALTLTVMLRWADAVRRSLTLWLKESIGVASPPAAAIGVPV